MSYRCISALFRFPNISTSAVTVSLTDKGKRKRGGLTHWDSERTHPNLHSPNDPKRAPDALDHDPIKRLRGQSITKKVFKQKQTREGLYGNAAVRVYNVQTACHGSDDCAHDLEPEEEVRKCPPVFHRVRGSPTEKVEPQNAGECLRDDEKEPEFGLEDAIVFAREPADGPVGDGANQEEAGGGAEEGTSIHITNLDFGEACRIAHELRKV